MRRNRKVVEAEEGDSCANCDWHIGSCIQYQFEKYAGKLNVTIIVKVITIIKIIIIIVIIIK